MDTALGIAFLGFIVFFSHFLVGVFSKTKIPDVLWLFLIGFLLGPILNLLRPEDFGIVGPLFTTITLVFILFESGLDLRMSSIRGSLKGTAAITLLNFLFTAVTITLASHAFAGIGWLSSVIVGSLLGGTSTAVITALVQKYDLRKETAAILIMESALSDVLTLSIPLALMRYSSATSFHIGRLTGQMLAAFFVAVLIGALGALLWSLLLRRVRTLENSIFTTPALAFIIYGTVEALGFSGPIGALTFGISLGNVKVFPVKFFASVLPEKPHNLNERERMFFAETVFLLRTFFFIYIGLSIELRNLTLMLVGCLLTMFLFVIRIPVVWFSISQQTSRKDASLMAVMIPKGLGAAVLATIPVQQGIQDGQAIQTLAFSVILCSTVFTTLLVFLLEKTPLGALYERLFVRFGKERGGQQEPPAQPR